MPPPIPFPFPFPSAFSSPSHSTPPSRRHLAENGPWHVNKNMTLSETPYGWDVQNTMIFVDQPIGTGFSYSDADEDRVYDEVKVARDMLDFLQELFKGAPLKQPLSCPHPAPLNHPPLSAAEP